jgi:hypothetical protein
MENESAHDTSWPIAFFKNAALGKVEFDDPTDKTTGEVKYRGLKIQFEVFCDVENARKLGDDFFSGLYDTDGVTLRKNIHNIKSKTQLFQVNRLTLTDMTGKSEPLTTECRINSSVKVTVIAMDHPPVMALQVQISRDHGTLCLLDDLKKSKDLSLGLVRSDAIERERDERKSVRERLAETLTAPVEVVAPRHERAEIMADPEITLESLTGSGFPASSEPALKAEPESDLEVEPDTETEEEGVEVEAGLGEG